MAGAGWRTEHSLIRQLASNPEWFDVFQAVLLMEVDAGRRGNRPPVPLGEGGDAGQEAVRFQAALSAQPTADHLDEVMRRQAPSGRTRYRVKTNFMGLAGPFAPLPAPIAELLADRVRAGDGAMRDFLDLFNHRLVSLLVRARRAHRPELTGRAPWDSNLAGWLAALCGLGAPDLRDRMAVPDRSLYRHAGLLNRPVASQHGLERLLGDHFGVPARVEPLTGDWMRLEPDDQTRLGNRADSARLGGGAVLGRRVWDQMAAITVELGPLDLSWFQAFLPGGDAAAALADLVRFHAGEGLGIVLRLRLKPEEVPAMDFRGPPRNRRLGRTSWLGARQRRESVLTLRLAT